MKLSHETMLKYEIIMRCNDTHDYSEYNYFTGEVNMVMNKPIVDQVERTRKVVKQSHKRVSRMPYPININR